MNALITWKLSKGLMTVRDPIRCPVLQVLRKIVKLCIQDAMKKLCKFE